MNKKEFKNNMKSIETNTFTCFQIHDLFGYDASQLYRELNWGVDSFNPVIRELFPDDCANFHIGDDISIEVRKILLRQFERIVIDTKLYKDF